jgi:transcriptional regulator with XRE-family HTH domain
VSGQDQSRQAHDSAKNFPLIRARFNAGLTQEQLGDAAGLSKQTISALENGARPQAPNAKRIADVLGVTAAELFITGPDPTEVAA